MKKIFIYLLIALIIFVVIQQLFLSGLNISVAESINTNLIADVLSVAATTFIIDKLLQKDDDVKRVKRYFEILNKSHEVLVSHLSMYFTHFVTKDSKVLEIEEVISNLDQYITKDFLKKRYTVRIINKDNIFQPREIEVSYKVFIEEYFKKKIEETITQYLSRYISIMPVEITATLIRIDDLLKSNILTTPIGLTDQEVDNAQFDPNDFIVTLKEIGNEIIKLKNFSI